MKFKLRLVVLSLVLFILITSSVGQRRIKQGSFASWLAGKLPGAKPPEPKYFREHPYYSHYDYRYMVADLDDHSKTRIIKVMVHSYLSTFRNLGVETWLMHGTLLAWWWGQKVQPFDLDADVQVTEADMYYLAAYHNMTIHYYKHGDMKRGRFYLLEVNPHFEHRDWDDKLNKIDARWIDMATGLFIDITAARYKVGHVAGEGMLYDKNKHEFRDTYLFPLQETTFEGAPAKIPYRYKDMLLSEYGGSALVEKRFAGYKFDDKAMEWVTDPDA